MTNIKNYFEKKKRELSNTSEDGQESKKQCEGSRPLSLEMSFEKVSDGDVFKESLKSEDCEQYCKNVCKI